MFFRQKEKNKLRPKFLSMTPNQEQWVVELSSNSTAHVCCGFISHTYMRTIYIHTSNGSPLLLNYRFVMYNDEYMGYLNEHNFQRMCM